MVLGFAIRSGLLVGTVYYTRKTGFWGDSEQTQTLYNDVKSFINPYAIQVKKQLPFDVPALPQVGEVRYLTKHYYNQGVKETFHFVHMLPCYTGRMLKKAKDTFDDFAQSPPGTTVSESKSTAVVATSKTK